jgi:prepilin-type N-terminal cleavage/methylation domain-containing protein
MSLIELLVVVVVLGILAGVVVFAVGGTGIAEQVQTCRDERIEVQQAVSSYRDETGRAPDLGDLLAGMGDEPALLDEPPQFWDVSRGQLIRLDVSADVPDAPAGCTAGA